MAGGGGGDGPGVFGGVKRSVTGSRVYERGRQAAAATPATGWKASIKEGYGLAKGTSPGTYTVAETGEVFQAKIASAEQPSFISKALGYSEQQRQANFNANALREAKQAARDLEGDPGLTQDERDAARRGQEEAAAAAAAPAAVAPGATYTTPAAAAPAAPVATPAVTTDYSKMLADMQAKYDKQLASFQSEMEAATKAQTDQLTKLTEAQKKHKKKLKKPGKYGRLSLLFGSELGIPQTTTLGG